MFDSIQILHTSRDDILINTEVQLKTQPSIRLSFPSKANFSSNTVGDQTEVSSDFKSSMLTTTPSRSRHSHVHPNPQRVA